MTSELNLKQVYLQSAIALEKADEDFKQNLDGSQREEFFSLKYMAIIVYNDLSREFYNMECNPTTNLSKLFSLIPVVHKLYEAYEWHRKEGNSRLRKLAKSRGILTEVDDKLRQLKIIKASNFNKYKIYRDKFSGHYDMECLNLIDRFGGLNFSEVESDMLSVIQHTNEWLEVLSYVGFYNRKDF